MQDMWNSLAPRARAGLAAGVLAIAALMAALAWWAYRTEYQVLFADVAAADAAAMTSELDKQKVPYRLADGGATILVPQDLVYKTRLNLMGREMPLHGAVGFEVFNNADFGMTDFVQKVNYQRALQGELTRTILAIEEVQAARVHLAMPEQGLFRKSASRAKASVTLTMKPRRQLSEEQVAGIQRLVAASVPDVASSDVTVVNQHGHALSQSAEAGEAGAAGLDSKRSAEAYLTRKVTAVLDRSFGEGIAAVSVDLALNMDQSKITTEEVLPGRAGSGAGGVVVRERHVSNGSPEAESGAARAPASSTTEADYQVGRRVEQTVVGSGAIRRMTVAVLVRQPMNEDQIEKLKEVVTLAVGFNSSRGDAVVVYPVDQFTPLGRQPAAVREAAPDAAPEAAPAPPAAAGQPASWQLPAAAVLLLVLLAGLAALALRRGRRAPVQQAMPPRLSEAQRAAALADIRQWIAADGAAPAEHGK